MTKSAKHFEEFKPHTLLKHLVLETYLKAWARKLLLRKGASSTVFYVDACAGRGMDDAGNRGSPVLAAREAAMVEGQLAEQFHLDVRVRVIAIEKRASHYKALAKNLEPFGDRALAVRGTLTDHLPSLLAEMGDAPALFFIDPFGIEPLKAEIVYRALARQQTEVFLLFADQSALRHYGVITATDEDEPPAEGQFGLGLEIAPEVAPLHYAELTAARDAKAEELLPTQEASEAIMNEAFGGRQWKERVDTAKPDARRRVVLDLYRELLYDAGARYVLEIPIRSSARRHVYHLFHATRSRHGYITMKEAVDFALKRAPVNSGAVEAIRFLIRSDMNAVEQRARATFAGQRVRWTADRDDQSAPSVRQFALEQTATFPSELAELKRRLEPLRDKTSRTLFYAFPSAQ